MPKPTIRLDEVRGQSLVEVIVSISITTLVLVGLVSAVTFALNNAQYARNKAAATKYSQEAVEWLRKERNASWTTFSGRADTDPGRLYCLNTLTWIAGSCSGTKIDNLFDRTATLTIPAISNDRVDITLEVNWKQGSRDSNVTVNTYLSKY